MEIKFDIVIKDITKGTFVNQETQESIIYYTAHLDNGYNVPITVKAVDAVKLGDFNLCLVNNKGKVKIDIYKQYGDTSHYSIFN